MSSSSADLLLSHADLRGSLRASHTLCLPAPLAGSYAGRASMEGATLTIHSITQKDSGDYRCEVTASQDHVNLGEATVSLNVLGRTCECVCLYVCLHIKKKCFHMCVQFNLCVSIYASLLTFV